MRRFLKLYSVCPVLVDFDMKEIEITELVG